MIETTSVVVFPQNPLLGEQAPLFSVNQRHYVMHDYKVREGTVVKDKQAFYLCLNREQAYELMRCIRKPHEQTDQPGCLHDAP